MFLMLVRVRIEWRLAAGRTSIMLQVHIHNINPRVWPIVYALPGCIGQVVFMTPYDAHMGRLSADKLQICHLMAP